MKQGFLLLLCVSAITVTPSCRNKRNENQEAKKNQPSQQPVMKYKNPKYSQEESEPLQQE